MFWPVGQKFGRGNENLYPPLRTLIPNLLEGESS